MFSQNLYRNHERTFNGPKRISIYLTQTTPDHFTTRQSQAIVQGRHCMSPIVFIKVTEDILCKLHHSHCALHHSLNDSIFQNRILNILFDVESLARATVFDCFRKISSHDSPFTGKNNPHNSTVSLLWTRVFEPGALLPLALIGVRSCSIFSQSRYIGYGISQGIIRER